MKDIEVFSCTRRTKEQTDLYPSLLKLGLHAHFVENNTAGLAEQYNRFLDTNVGTSKIALFAHDDVAIEDVFVREKLNAGAEHFAIQGLAGAASFDLQLEWPQTVWLRAPREYLSGAVEHR